ncbi:MAG: OmpH family outer membrane protein [Rhodothermales bacterium]
MKSILQFLGLSLLMAFVAAPATQAQQKIGYVDSEYILNKTPEYATVQQQLDRMAQEWQQEIEKLRKEVDELFREYQARELLYTSEERLRKRETIVQAEEDVERMRMQYFGPEGELFKQQENLMKPIQEKVLVAIEEIATQEGYDYVFDKGGDYLFMYAREQFDLSDQVLEELGIDIENQGTSTR